MFRTGTSCAAIYWRSICNFALAKIIGGAVSVQEQFAEVRDALPIPFGLARPLSAPVAPSIRRIRRVHAFSKRVLDLVIAVLAIVFLTPVLMLVALLIKSDSAGPA